MASLANKLDFLHLSPVTHARESAEAPADTTDVKTDKIPDQSLSEAKYESNLSFILNKPLEVTYAERPVPKLPDPHHVLVAVDYTGICGSDVHYYDHGRIGPFVVENPMVLGHESAGRVVEVGSEVTTLAVGDRVALEPGYPCRHCVECLSGHYNLCPKMRFAATPPYDGTLAGYWVAPADFCYRLPDNVSTQEGALVEPLAVGVHIVRQAGVTPGSTVVVMGAGPVGLLCAAVARAFGASKVVSVDIVESKLQFARKLAATHTYLSQRVSPEENAANIIREAGLGKGADCVIDASGAEPSIQASLHVVRVGGTYVQGGMGKPDITFPIMALCIKEVTAKGSFRYGSGDYKLAVELLADGKVDVRSLISDTVSFDRAEEAFKKVKEGQVIKILIAGPNSKEHPQQQQQKKEEEVAAAAPDAPAEQTAADKTAAECQVVAPAAAETKDEVGTAQAPVEEVAAAPAAEEVQPEQPQSVEQPSAVPTATEDAPPAQTSAPTSTEQTETGAHFAGTTTKEPKAEPASGTAPAS